MRKFNSSCRSEEADNLFQTVLTLDNIEEVYRFFKDLCTEAEIKNMTERYHIARLLSERKTYIDIEYRTGASTATISRVNRHLHYGNDGYMIGIEKMREKKS